MQMPLRPARLWEGSWRQSKQKEVPEKRKTRQGIRDQKSRIVLFLLEYIFHYLIFAFKGNTSQASGVQFFLDLLLSLYSVSHNRDQSRQSGQSQKGNEKGSLRRISGIQRIRWRKGNLGLLENIHHRVSHRIVSNTGIIFNNAVHNIKSLSG